jgi:hypothetical protein
MMIKAVKFVPEAKCREIFFQIVLPEFVIFYRFLAATLGTALGDIARNYTFHSGKSVEDFMDKGFLHLFIRIAQARNQLGARGTFARDTSIIRRVSSCSESWRNFVSATIFSPNNSLSRRQSKKG